MAADKICMLSSVAQCFVNILVIGYIRRVDGIFSSLLFGIIFITAQ